MIVNVLRHRQEGDKIHQVISTLHEGRTYVTDQVYQVHKCGRTSYIASGSWSSEELATTAFDNFESNYIQAVSR